MNTGCQEKRPRNQREQTDSRAPGFCPAAGGSTRLRDSGYGEGRRPAAAPISNSVRSGAASGAYGEQPRGNHPPSLAWAPPPAAPAQLGPTLALGLLVSSTRGSASAEPVSSGGSASAAQHPQRPASSRGPAPPRPEPRRAPPGTEAPSPAPAPPPAAPPRPAHSLVPGRDSAVRKMVKPKATRCAKIPLPLRSQRLSLGSLAGAGTRPTSRGCMAGRAPAPSRRGASSGFAIAEAAAAGEAPPPGAAAARRPRPQRPLGAGGKARRPQGAGGSRAPGGRRPLLHCTFLPARAYVSSSLWK